MRNVIAILLPMVVFVISSYRLDADIITTVDIELRGGVRAIDGLGNVNFEVFSTTVDGPPRLYTVFEDLVLSEADIGTTYRADSGSYLGFNDMVLFLTNGEQDRFGYWLTLPHDSGSFGNGFSTHESNIFSSASLNGIDLQGYRIDFFTLRLDGLSFTSPGEDPNGDGLWSDFTFDATFTVYGSIPEPSSCFVLIGFSVFVLSRRRSQLDCTII